MAPLDIFALFVLCTLVVTFLGVWVALGMMPGRIARQRQHPQAEAINVCGWWGVLSMGLLLPLAFIWAYTNSKRPLLGRSSDQHTDEKSGEENLS